MSTRSKPDSRSRDKQQKSDNNNKIKKQTKTEMALHIVKLQWI